MEVNEAKGMCQDRTCEDLLLVPIPMANGNDNIYIYVYVLVVVHYQK